MLTDAMQADMVLESIGYRSLPLAGAPFDERRGVIPNRYQPTGCDTCTCVAPRRLHWNTAAGLQAGQSPERHTGQCCGGGGLVRLRLGQARAIWHYW